MSGVPVEVVVDLAHRLKAGEITLEEADRAVAFVAGQPWEDLAPVADADMDALR